MAIEYDQTADHYIALGVASTATHDDIKKAHRALIRELHPDHGGESMSAAQVNIARDILLNTITREEYDEARRSWHERNPIVSAFSDAAQQAHRGGTLAQRASANQSAGDASAAHSRPAAQPHPDAAQHRPTSEWHVEIVRTLVAEEFMRAMLSGQWLNAIAIMGSAYILDRVIENRIGQNPARREALDAIAKEIGERRDRRVMEALVTQAGYRWDAATDSWILPPPSTAAPTKSPRAASSASRRPRSSGRRTSGRSGVLGRTSRPGSR